MTDVNKDQLRRLAEAATPGQWVTEDEDFSLGGNVIGVYVAHQDGGRIGQAFANCLVPTDAKCRAYAAFMAAANPAAVLSLLDELEAFRKDAERYQWLRDKSEALHSFYLSTPIWMTGVSFRKVDVDRSIDIDIAMSKVAPNV